MTHIVLFIWTYLTIPVFSLMLDKYENIQLLEKRGFFFRTKSRSPFRRASYVHITFVQFKIQIYVHTYFYTYRILYTCTYIFLYISNVCAYVYTYIILCVWYLYVWHWKFLKIFFILSPSSGISGVLSV